jgi:hypothetical protein
MKTEKRQRERRQTDTWIIDLTPDLSLHKSDMRELVGLSHDVLKKPEVV